MKIARRSLPDSNWCIRSIGGGDTFRITASHMTQGWEFVAEAHAMGEASDLITQSNIAAAILFDMFCYQRGPFTTVHLSDLQGVLSLIGLRLAWRFSRERRRSPFDLPKVDHCYYVQ